MLKHGAGFSLGSAKVCSPAIFEPYIYYDKDIWIAVTYDYIAVSGGFDVPVDSTVLSKTRKTAVLCHKIHVNIFFKVRNTV